MNEAIREWLYYEQGSHVAISTDSLTWVVVILAAAVLVLATWLHPGLRRRVWR